MKRTQLYFLVFLPVLLAVTALIYPWPRAVLFSHQQNRGAAPSGENSASSTSAADDHRMIFLLQYIGNDYSLAVQSGAVISDFEYREMQDFAATVVRQYQSADKTVDSTAAKLQRLEQMIAQKAEPEVVRAASLGLIGAITRERNILPFPLAPPNLAAGKKFFESACASCHGLAGDGRGPAADTLNPKPRDFTDPSIINGLAPYQIYQAMTFGVEGTAMPSFDLALTTPQRWDIAFYLPTLRRDFHPATPDSATRFTLQDLATRSNLELAELLLANDGAENGASPNQMMGMVDYYRQNVPRLTADEYLTIAEKTFRQSVDAYRRGDFAAAHKLAVDGYLQGFEPIEAYLERSLKTGFENALARYRQNLNERRQAEPAFTLVLEKLDEARAALTGSALTRGFYLLQALTILLREGVEAALLIALMFAFAAAADQRWMKPYILGGAVGGLAAGGLTWLAAQYLINITSLGNEALEGITSLAAAAVLLTVCLWLIHNADIQRWKNLIRRQAEEALGGGGKWAIALTAFLAVYREAFETVLVYQALWLRPGSAHTG
ncbi:MAG: FTR1 family protein, partial [candidate division KSB1 bacterium]|nr:FTR1 family protein [candidate division KSB1 bacterium]